MQTVIDMLKSGSDIAGMAVVLVVFLFGIYLFVSLLRRGLRTAAGKDVVVKAKIIDKFVNEPDWQRRSREYVVSFETGGIVLKLKVPAWVYDGLEVGDKGRLAHHLGTFLHFKKDKK